MEKQNSLYIIWTNADILTSENMVMRYATNSMLRQWWDAVTVVIWGAPAKLVAENDQIQNKIKVAQQAGVKFSACKACTDQLEVSDKLIDLDIEVIFWGEKLTSIIKNGDKLITI